MTSATLTDGEADPTLAWSLAEAASGLRHLTASPRAARIASPFDYAAQTRILIVNDIPRDDVGQIAAGFAALMQAAKGGALGLFTAISRLRAVHERIAPVLEGNGILLLAQHVDAMSPATLVEIFRAEENSCLLGTDAMRDGVDVPGRSLRLIVFDRVPWPRPDILHRARKPVFGGANYEDHIARLRLRQAYGRLIRRADDRGVFVVLDRQLPSRLLAAFPEGVSVARVPLTEAVDLTAGFLGDGSLIVAVCVIICPRISAKRTGNARPPRRADLHDGDRHRRRSQSAADRGGDHRRHCRPSAGVPRISTAASSLGTSTVRRSAAAVRTGSSPRSTRSKRRCRSICARPPTRSPAISSPPTARRRRRNCSSWS